MHYRQDIDGLRAIAVLPVIAFHLGMPGVSGGYVGVDVFFVISGYLVGGAILGELNEGRFLYLDFYRRRLKRIFPAFIIMLTIVSIASCVILLPTMLYHFGQSAISALGHSSNIYFWLTSSYFAPTSESKPLLHTWSLAVEEQFYVVLPAILALLNRSSNKRVWLGLLVFISFLTSVITVNTLPTFAFYMLPTRFWELGLGILVVTSDLNCLKARLAREFIATTGFLLIFSSIILLDKGSKFPGVTALAPCIGAAFVIAACGQGHTGIGKLLCLSPIVAIGQLSYSLYLWHWPVIVLTQQYLLVDKFELSTVLFVVSLTSVLAVLSLWLIERPLRRSRAGFSRVFISVIVATLGIGLGAAIVLSTRGLPNRFDATTNKIAAYLDYDPRVQFRQGTCFVESSAKLQSVANECMIVRGDIKNVLLVGDSFAAHLWYGLNKSLPDVNLMQATMSNCLPFQLSSAFASRSCVALLDHVYNDFLQNHRVDMLIISARWAENDLPFLASTLRWARERAILTILVGPLVEYALPLPELVAFARIRSDPDLVQRQRRVDRFELDQDMRQLSEVVGTPYFSPIKALCEHDRCQTLPEHDVPLQYDYGHLTLQGSELIGSEIAKLVRAKMDNSPAPTAQ